MNIEKSQEEYCEFFTQMGHRVILEESGIWINIRPFIFQQAAVFRHIQTAPREMKRIFKNNALACVWFSDKTETKGGAKRFLYLAHPPYDFSSLEHKTRNQTKRGLSGLQIEKVDVLEGFLDEARVVYEDNVKRLKLFSGQKKIDERWLRWVRALQTSSSIECWAARKEKSLAAFSVVLWSPWGVEIMMQRSLQTALSYYPNNALIYSICRDAFERKAELVSFGLSAYNSKNSGLDHFKVNMGFKSIPLTEHYEWHPWIKPLANLIKPDVLYRKVFSR